VPQYSTEERSALAATFRALADSTRLAVVERLGTGPASASQLAEPFDMALPSFMQHLGVLEHAGIVSSHKAGRTRTYQLVPGALRDASAWMTSARSHWEQRFDQLDELLTGAAPHAVTRSESRSDARPEPEQDPS
jgi:DNA-binding transcriptional ArsR family regulator